MSTPPESPLITAETFWRQSSKEVILDVRSPGEFLQGHIPGAINLPLFDDDQRAEIGILYKKSGHDAAVLRGLRIIGPKMADLVVQAQKACNGSKEVLLHCWRGGQRSQSMAWLLRTAGMRPSVLDGGYKAFRKYAQEFFERPWNLQIVSGLTGAGKTRVLHLLADAGEQILDLEGMANHRGSAFGGIGQSLQPRTEQFENELFVCLESFIPKNRIWVEDEGNRIGTVVVPHPFYQLMRRSPAIFLDSSVDDRVNRLMIDYGELPVSDLDVSITRIQKRLGGQHANEAHEAVASGNIRRAIEIVLAYYDKTYMNAANKMPRPEMPSLPIDGLSDSDIVRQAIALPPIPSLPA